MTARRSGEPSQSIVFGVALFAAAFALRFLVARLVAGEPVWDGHYYDFGAHRIAEGHGYSDDRVVAGVTEWHPWCHYPVGYSAFLAAFYVVLGAHAWVAHLANALTGAGLAVVVWLLGREAMSEGRARVGGVLVALHPGLVLYGALVMGELVSALSTMAAFWLAMFLARRTSPLWAVAASAFVLGLGALVRPQALLCAPFLGLVVGLERRAWKAWLVSAVVACMVALVPVVPWTARNCRVMDGCALVSTNAGWNLAIGAFPRATGRFETLRSSDGCSEVTGQVQQDRCWLHYGVANILATPGRWLGLIPAKLGNTFDHESFAVEYLHEARPDEWPDDRRARWRGALSWLHRALLGVAGLAFVARRGRVQVAVAGVIAIAWLLGASASPSIGPTFWPLVVIVSVLAVLPLPGRPAPRVALLLPIALLATTALTHAVFFGDDRYHMVITPALCLYAAAALRRPQNTHGAKTGEVGAPRSKAQATDAVLP